MKPPLLYKSHLKRGGLNVSRETSLVFRDNIDSGIDNATNVALYPIL